MDKLSCALKDVPQSIINQIVTDQMKKKVREVIEDDAFNDVFEACIETEVTKYMKLNCTSLVKQYLDKHAEKIIKGEIDSHIDDNGLPTKVWNIIQQEMTEAILSKFKKGGKK